jgi:DNA-binding protein HU-beta
MKINKTDFIYCLSYGLNINVSEATKIYEEFIHIIESHLRTDCEINLNGFGKFKTVTRKTRKGINPKTFEPLDIPASKTVAFVTSKVLKAWVNPVRAKKEVDENK